MKEILANTKLKDREYPFKYSNFGFAVLGQIVGSVSGQGFWDSMETFIREDLGLKNTYLGHTDLPGFDKKDQQCNCWKWGKGDTIAPAGALISTVPDLLDFAAMQLDGSHPYLALCHEPHGHGEKTFESGYAWRLENGTNISWHGGAAGAYSAFLGFDRKTGTCVCTATNYGLVDAEGLGLTIMKNL